MNIGNISGCYGNGVGSDVTVTTQEICIQNPNFPNKDSLIDCAWRFQVCFITRFINSFQ